MITMNFKAILLLVAIGLAAMGKTEGSSLAAMVDAKTHLNHVVDDLDLLLYVSLLVLTIVTAWAMHVMPVRCVHESGLAIIFGLAVGAMLRISGKSFTDLTVLSVVPSKKTASTSPPDNLLLTLNSSKTFVYSFEGELVTADMASPVEDRATFNPEIFFNVLLPPIIFHAGYSMHRKHFFENIGAILTYALLGTTLSTLAIAAILTLTSVYVVELGPSFLENLYFGAVVSATDPVTVLAIFGDLHADPVLHGLILGESLLNDAVALVLADAIQHYIEMTTNDELQLQVLGVTLINFLTTFFGSIGLGLIVGFISAFLTKHSDFSDRPLLETCLFALLSYCSYLLAEITDLSGIVAILFCGVAQAHYTYPNLSPESRSRTTQLFETLNFLAESLIFSYIGVSLLTFRGHIFSRNFVITAFIAILVARAINVYPLSLLINCTRNQHPIPKNFQHMLWYSGLRGAMSFALAVRNTASATRQMFFTTTCLIASFTVVIVGGFTPQALSLLKIPVGVDREETLELRPLNERSKEEDNGLSSSDFSNRRRGFLARAFKHVDYHYLKPLLSRANNEQDINNALNQAH